MANIIFDTVHSGHNYTNLDGATVNGNAMIGRYETAIKSIIRHESDLHTKNNDLVKALFNVMKSNKHAESFVMQNEFDMFDVVGEGERHPLDTYGEVGSKTFKHYKFAKSFVITDVMMSDALTNQIRQEAENFTRAYYKTRNHFASRLYTGATAATMNFAGGTFDLTTSDGQPLFSTQHTAGGSTVSNKHHTILGSGAKIDAAAVESALTAAAENVRNMKDENGYSLGYTADTVMIPCNDRKLEHALRKALGSEFSSNASGALSGAINTQYGAWTLIINPFWEVASGNATAHPMIVTSSAAKRALMAPVFFDRWPLRVTNRVDEDTGNYVWNGKARMSGGFVTYKFADLFQIVDNGTTTLYDGTATSTSNNSTSVTL